MMKAIIFDLDGVLLDTGILHRESLIEAIRITVKVDVSSFEEVSEQSMDSSRNKITKVLSKLNIDTSFSDKILSIKDKIFFNKIKDITVSANVIESLEYVRSLNIKTAIASNSRLVNMKKILKQTGLRKYFDTIVSADEVLNRKPAPDILFKVYDRLNLTVSESAKTLFIDDTDEGCAAGHSSLSTTVKINNPSELTVDLLKKWIK